MSRTRGFTLLELVLVIFLLVLFVGVFEPLHRDRAPLIAKRMVCGAYLSGLYKAMYSYSQNNADWFPIAGERNSAGEAHGFTKGLRDRSDVKSDDPAMVNNVTASLWILVRDGSVGGRSFICPSSGNEKDMLLGAEGEPVSLRNIRDFAGADNLSYSPINMYHESAQRQWSANVDPDFVLLGDNNNADGADANRAFDRQDRKAVERANSRNHYGDGQELLYGDGHVAWVADPLAGLDGDDVYAMTIDGKAVPPTMSNTAGDGAVLLPITGNNGVSLSGEAGPGHRSRPGDYGWMWFVVVWGVIIGVAVGICVVLDRVWRMVKHRQTPVD